MEVSYRESFNKTKKERQQRALVRNKQGLEGGGGVGGGVQVEEAWRRGLTANFKQMENSYKIFKF